MPHRRRWPLFVALAPAVTALFSATVSWAAGHAPAPSAPAHDPTGTTTPSPTHQQAVAHGRTDEDVVDVSARVARRAVWLHLRRTEQPAARPPASPAEARPTPKPARRATPAPSPRPVRSAVTTSRTAPPPAAPRREVKPAPKPRPKSPAPTAPKPAQTQHPTPAPAPAPAPTGPPPVPTTGS